MKFIKKIEKITQKNNSLLCIGLDIDEDKLPKFLFSESKNPFFEFNKQIIDNTKDLVCAYKMNLAFYEALGLKGLKTLEKTINYIPNDIIVIIDGKRNDIGNTAKKYAKYLFEILKADATTINPYLGEDGIKPFINYKNNFSFILCKTSNPSSNDFQNIKFKNTPLYQFVAQKIKTWNINNNLGAVIGATYPNELKKIREILGNESYLLIPGIGKQGGDIKITVKYGTNKNMENAIINSSRAIIYKSKNKDFAKKARKAASGLRDEINQYR